MQRFRITFDRIPDSQVKYYNIYRKSEDSHSKCIMKVYQRDFNPIQVTNETLTKIDSNKWQAIHGQIVLSSVVLKIGSINIPANYYELNSQDGIFIVDEYYLIDKRVPSDAIAIASYEFDGISVLDDNHLQPGVDYYGPYVSMSNKVYPPQSVSITYDRPSETLNLTWSKPLDIETEYTYYVIAYDDKNNYSWPSKQVTGIFTSSQNVAGYKIEKLVNNKWHSIGYTDQLSFSYDIQDFIKYLAPYNLTAESYIIQSTGKGNIRLKWSLPENYGLTSGYFRIIAVNNLGYESEPSPEVDTIIFGEPIDKQILRFKVDDGSIPSIDESDAETVVTLFSDVKEYLHESINDNTSYIYALYSFRGDLIADEPLIIRVTLGDATPPDTVEIVDIEIQPL